MKTLPLLSVFFAVILSDICATTVSTVVPSTIPTRRALALDAIAEYKNSSDYLDAFIEQKWNGTDDIEGTFRTDRASRIRVAFKNRREKLDYEEVKFMTTTIMNNLLNDEDALKLRRAYLECIDKTFVKIKHVLKFKAGSWAEHPALSEWALCVLVKMGLMSPQGVYQYSTAMSKINFNDKYEVEKILRQCLKPMSPQKIAWKYLKCVSRKDWKKQYPYLSIFYNSAIY